MNCMHQGQGRIRKVNIFTPQNEVGLSVRVVTSLPGRVQNIPISVSVLMSVWMSAGISHKPHVHTSRNLPYMLPWSMLVRPKCSRSGRYICSRSWHACISPALQMTSRYWRKMQSSQYAAD